MKALVLLLVALFVGWRLRRWINHKALQSRSPVAPPTAMVPCSHCGVHFPNADAFTGARGRYCCADHRAAAED